VSGSAPSSNSGTGGGVTGSIPGSNLDSTGTVSRRSSGDSLLAPLGWFGGGDPLGFDLGFRQMERQMERMMQRIGRVEEDDEQWASGAGPDSSSYSYSSSRTLHTGADGKTFSRESRNERRRIGSLLEEQSFAKDSLGNERSAFKRGMEGKTRELVVDKNAKGEKRQVENLRHLKPEQVKDFDQQWESARERILSQGQSQAQGRLQADQPMQSALTAGETSTSQTNSAVPQSKEAKTAEKHAPIGGDKTDEAAMRGGKIERNTKIKSTAV